MPPTESGKSREARRGSKRTGTSTLGMTTRSRAHAQRESQPVREGSRTTGSKRKSTAAAEAAATPPAPAPGMTTRSRARTQQAVARTKAGEGPSKLDEIDHSLPDWFWEEYENCSEENDDDYSYCSSVVSSPLRVPYMLDESTGDSEVAKKYMELKQAFDQKYKRVRGLPMLITAMHSNCLVDDPALLHIRESAWKMVLRAAQFVVGISSSIDGQPLAQCSGFLIDLDNESRAGTVVTTALLIRTKQPYKNAWLCKDQYAPDAKVTVHLRGYKTVEADLLYYQKHYNLAFFRVRVDQSVQLPSYSDNVKCGQDIFEIGRDERLQLLTNHGRVEYSNPTVYERHHHMYVQGPERDRMYDKGGPIIDLDGKVVGMIDGCSGGSFIPSSILLKCFNLWRNFGYIPRPHLGLQFNAISLLSPAQAEHLLIVYGIDEGLVVHKVSGDSPAEKCGSRMGDIIECVNGKSISTTVELENMLLSIMENRGDSLNSDLDLEIQVIRTGRTVRRVKVLTVNVSDDGERCELGRRLVT